jgi:hypothetical protein
VRAVDPHAQDLAASRSGRLEHPAPGRLAAEAGEQQIAGGGQRALRVEAGLEALGQLGEVVASGAIVTSEIASSARTSAWAASSRARCAASSGSSTDAASSSESRSSSRISARPAGVTRSCLERRSAACGAASTRPSRCSARSTRAR